jgi:hypothetical protein
MLVWESQCFDLKEMAECQELCKLSKVLASFVYLDKVIDRRIHLLT